VSGAYDPVFDAAVMAGPIVDNASDRLWGPNGEPDDQPDRPDGQCGFCGGVGTVDDGDRLCPVGCWRAVA
jgi:hypothetical protein